jgi:hypothetical protein
MTVSPGTIYLGGTPYVFQLWKGQIFPKQNIADFYARMGQAGTGVQILGSVAPPSPIEAHYFTTTRGAAFTFRGNVMGLIGQYVNIVEPDAASWTGALIKSAVGRITNGLYTINNTSYPVRVAFSLVIEAQT